MRGRLLIIDDDQDIRDSLVSLLASEEYETVPANGGPEALRLLEQGSFDAVVLDLLMPTMNGAQVAAAIKDDPRWAALPVIVCSAGPVPQEVAARAFAVLRKPFDLDRLLDLLAAACKTA